jgi:hypothetical protein
MQDALLHTTLHEMYRRRSGNPEITGRQVTF